MAGMDYGGYVFRNGILIPERSDCSITRCGRTISGHAVLGEDVFVALHKQAWFSVYDLLKEENPVPENKYNPYLTDNRGSLDWDSYVGKKIPLRVCISGASVDIQFTEEDNYYQYARIVKDSVTWCGFSGYCVGAGWEQQSEYSTIERVIKLNQLWPGSVLESELSLIVKNINSGKILSKIDGDWELPEEFE